MTKHPLFFLFGFAFGFLPMLLFLSKVNNKSEILAEEPAVKGTSAPKNVQTEKVGQISIVVETPVTSSPTPVFTPTMAPTPTPIVEPTPTPAPTPTPDVWPPPDMEPLFSRYSGMYSVDKNTLERLANCESHFNPNAISPDGKYVGMFQFSVSTWTTYRMRLGQDANADLRKDVEESIKTAAFVIQQRGVSPWPNCLR